ncbi:histidinol-phosphate transaminase [Mesobacillus maritimus]|uniref:histidinol-phosphate transaminase n=1 Tax=Mesobacillus maritimus TaxID=1643336 RepID=UPI002041A7F0|nr:histidinol-phosphate transaminase [Mesobacillus maritimus]MCM3586507.1 histidinol-phosphate transaminase [Mesobacillus maritimus]MCM3669461.1 histidinol-phosphate transaminase [Mesobacillus maritimus]
MKWKQPLLSLKPYQPGRTIEAVKKQFGLDHIVKLASNENPFGCSPKAEAVIRNFTPSLALYPDGYATELRDAVAQHVKLKPEQLIFGDGSDELIQIISRALLRPGVNTVMATGTFSQYKHNAVIEDCEIREIPLIEGAHDLPSMLEAIDENTSVVWLCSPNNPTGVYIKSEEIYEFLSKVPEDVLVVLDEAYYEYVHADDYYDSISLVKQNKNLIVLRTFSKIYGLASLRIGYGIADEAIIKALDPARPPFNVNAVGQAAAIEAIRDQDFVEKCKQTNIKGLQQFYQFCKEQQLKYYPSHGNFILIEFGCDGNEVFEFLMERGFIVRSGVPLGFPNCVRVTVGSREQNDGVISKMKEFLAAKATLS